MNMPLVIHGQYAGQTFVPDEPMPLVEGRAELVVFPAATPASSIFDLFGKAPQLRTAADIDAQVREEREAWDER